MESVTDISADINKKYRCVSNSQIRMNNVTVTLRDATIQAYLSNNSFSREGKSLPWPWRRRSGSLVQRVSARYLGRRE